MNAVPRISGCEAAYWLPMDVDICGSLETPGHDESASSTMQGHEMASLEDSQEGRKEAGDGNLVVHVRSGDIFKSEIHRSYGQVREIGAEGSGLFSTACTLLKMSWSCKIVVPRYWR